MSNERPITAGKEAIEQEIFPMLPKWASDRADVVNARLSSVTRSYEEERLQMRSLHDREPEKFKVTVEATGAERREHRRHDMETQDITIDRWDGSRRSGETFGKIIDLSAGGVRIRTEQAANVRADQQVRVRIELPNYAGICPFIDTTKKEMEPKREWVGWMAVARVNKSEEGEVEVAGRLVDMDEMDRGMLGLYLSTQPLAA